MAKVSKPTNMPQQTNSEVYNQKRAFFDKILTIYGRNAVAEALEDETLGLYKLHLSTSNKPAPALEQMVIKAKERGAEVCYHDKEALSRISKNSRQDQGVALDILMEFALDEERFLESREGYRLLALDGVSNPQNIGMIIRSAVAGNIDAILLSSQLGPLVIKASSGTLFKMPIIKTKNLQKSLKFFQSKGATLYGLSSHAQTTYKEEVFGKRSIFVLGNESDGVSGDIAKLCDKEIAIPMNRGVESLNVAITAALLSFMD